MKSTTECRRQFLKATLAGGLAATIVNRFGRSALAAAGARAVSPAAPAPAPAGAETSPKVALTHGDNRTDNVFRGLNALKDEIARAIGNRRVIIKPNNVSPNNQLASSHADALAGILDFLQSIGKLETAIIAESAMSNTMQGFQNFGYTKLADKYHVKLVDLDQEAFQTIMAFNETDATPHPCRISSLLTNQADNFIISACMLKTHDRAVATMSIKNIILGAPLKVPNPNGGGGGMMGGRGGRGGRGGGFGGSDKGILHGGGAHGININLAMLAPLLHPSLSVIDGFQGMEGAGPLSGTAVDHRVCVVSRDYVAADSVGASLMGINPMDVGYINYLSGAKIGQADTTKMEILGEPIAKLAKKYQLAPGVQNQLQWKTPARVTAT